MKPEYEDQLSRWVNGDSIHLQDQCTPDFSCCQPQLLATEDERRKFASADENGRMSMLGMFLGRAIALNNSNSGNNKSVYISSPSPNHGEKGASE
jgi:hypothetical protein